VLESSVVLPQLSEIRRYLQRRATAAAAKRNTSRPCPPDGTGDPVTSERIYSDEEFEFLRAMERFQAETGTRWPTVSQYLDVLKSLGYERPTP